MSNKTRLLKNSIYLYIRLGLLIIVGLISSRVILEQLGVDDYGLYSLIGGFVALLSILSSILTGSVSRFITFEIGKGDYESIRTLVLTIINALLIFAIIIFVIGTLIGPPIINYFLNIPKDNLRVALFVYFCSLASFCFNIFALPYQSLVIAYEKISFYSITSILESLLKLIAALLLFIIKDNRLYYYAIFILLISVIIRILYGIYCSVKFSVSKYKYHFNKKLIKPLFGFSIWIGFGSITGILKDQGTTILLNLFFGLVLNTVRGISLQVMSVMNQFTSTIGLAISPQITKAYSSGDKTESVNLTIFSTKVQGFLILLISIPFLISTSYLLKIWLKDFPEQTVPFVQWTIISCIITTLTNSCNPLFLAVGKLKIVQIMSGIVNILYVIFCYIGFKLGFSPVICMILLVFLSVIHFFILTFSINSNITFPLKYFISNCFFLILLIGSLDYIITKTFISIIKLNGFIELIINFLLSSLLLSSFTFLILDKKEKSQLKLKLKLAIKRFT